MGQFGQHYDPDTDVAPVMNIREFGGIGNGVADDTAAIATAIARAATAGGQVYFPAGVYLTDKITAISGGITLWGDGPTKSILKSRAGQTVIEITGVDISWLTLRDFGIVGTGQTGNSGHGIYAHDLTQAARNVHFDNLHILTCGGNGIRLGNTAIEADTIFSSKFSRIDIDSCGSDLFFASRVEPTTVFEYCLVWRVLAGKWGFNLNGTFTMIGCNGQDNNVGADIGGGWAQLSGSVVLINCNMEGFTSTAINLVGINSDFHFINCIWRPFEDRTDSVAVQIPSSNQPVIFEGCHFYPESIDPQTPWKNLYPIHGTAGPAKPLFIGVDSTVINSIYMDDDHAAYPAARITSRFGFGTTDGSIGVLTNFEATLTDLMVKTKKFKIGNTWPDGTYSVGDTLAYTSLKASNYAGEIVTTAGSVSSGAKTGGMVTEGYGWIDAATLVTSPLQMPNCILWLDGADASTITVNTDGTGGTPSNGGAVGRWADKSGQALHYSQATSGNRPTYRTSALNSKGGVRFVAASSQSLTGSLTVPQQVTIFVVYTGYTAGCLLGTSPDHLLQSDSNAWFDTNAQQQSLPAALSANNIFAAQYDYTSDVYQVHVGTLASGRELNTSGSMAGTMSVGFGFGTYLSADIAEIIVYQGVLDDKKVSAVRNYLKSKWAV